MCWDVECEFVVATAEVLDEGVSVGDHRCQSEAFEAAHRAEPGPQPAVVGFDAVVGVLLRYVWACGTSSSRTRRYRPALSVVISTGAGPWVSARVKNGATGEAKVREVPI